MKTTPGYTTWQVWICRTLTIFTSFWDFDSETSIRGSPAWSYVRFAGIVGVSPQRNVIEMGPSLHPKRSLDFTTSFLRGCVLQ